jgi:F0F1-type ATP synthase gamma subunit
VRGSLVRSGGWRRFTLRGRGDISYAFTELGKARPPTFAEISLVAEYILSQPADAVSFVYNKYRSAIAYDTTVTQARGFQSVAADQGSFGGNIEFEGDREETLQNLYEFRTAVG